MGYWMIVIAYDKLSIEQTKYYCIHDTRHIDQWQKTIKAKYSCMNLHTGYFI